MNVVNSILSRIKGQEYKIDDRLPVSYLLTTVLVRMVMLLRGKFSFIDNGGAFFIGKNVEIVGKKLMKVGRGVSINDDCYVNAISVDGIILGNNSSLGKRSVIECSGSLQHLGKGLIVGENVGLGRDSFYGCAGGVIIGSDTIIGNFVSFHSENHVYSDSKVPIRLQGVCHKGIKVGKNCWIGAKATILDGAVIGDGCIVAAGAVVKSGLYPENVILGGVPAKIVSDRVKSATQAKAFTSCETSP